MQGIHINGAYPYVMYMLLNAAYVTPTTKPTTTATHRGKKLAA